MDLKPGTKIPSLNVTNYTLNGRGNQTGPKSTGTVEYQCYSAWTYGAVRVFLIQAVAMHT